MLHVFQARWREGTFITDFGNSLVIVVCFLVLSVSFATMSGKDEGPVKSAMIAVGKGNARFTTNVYKAVCGKEGNIFISPLSVETVVALAYMGAAGQTAEEISAALHLPSDREDVKAGFKGLLGSLKSSGNMTMEVANKVFSQKNYGILQEYKSVAEQAFLSGAQELDFANSEGARNTINSWVAERTRNKIRDLIPSGLLNSLTRLVLVNAVYFKGLWKKQFDAAQTKPEKFHLNSKVNKEIPMMHKKANFGYLESKELKSTILEMPYQGDQNISMFVILPNDIDGISEVEKKLVDFDLTQILKRLPSQEVIVTMPKFKLEETTDFDTILKTLGMNTMYIEGKADFSGISGTRDLYVSKVLQKAFIEVNEEGSEAAAATAMMFNTYSMPPPPETFLANHAFVFVIQELNSGTVLFVGRFSSP